MITGEDPFAVLGLQQEASLDEVKRAYRRLAMRWHPDRNPSLLAANEFKRVHAAYELLLDAERLAEWQQTQSTVPETEGGGKVGDDLTQALTLTLEEAALGCRKAVELLQRVACTTCRSSGRLKHQNSVPCPRCSGCGRVVRAGGRTSRCDGCAGRGYLRETDCPDCAGSGWGQEMRTLSVSVPAGVLEGERLRLARQAPLAAHDAIAGDLYLEIRLAVHPLFVLDGQNLHCRVPVSVFRLLCGGSIEVPTLAGTARLEIPACLPRSVEWRLPGLGFPGKRRAAAGDLVVHLHRIDPVEIGSDDRPLLEELEARLAAEIHQRAPDLAAWEQQMHARRNFDGC